MRKILLFMTVVLVLTTTVSAQEKEISIVPKECSGIENSSVPVSYSDWTDWGLNQICCDAGLILWENNWKASIALTFGTYLGTQSQDQQACAECPTEYRYRIKYYEGRH